MIRSISEREDSRMIKQFGMGVGLMVCAAGLAQQPAKPVAGKSWNPPKTAWGEPDLQGIWPLNHLIATPFQRPEKYGERRFLTEEELAAAKKNADARNK